jgi:hypothetical protein
MIVQSERRRRLIVGAAIVAAFAAIAAAAWLGFGRSGAAATNAAAEPEAVQSPPPSAEGQAKADLDKLVRDYESAQNAAYLDPTIDPDAAMGPYLRYTAREDRVADIQAFRDEGSTFDSRTVDVHTVTVEALDLDTAEGISTATVQECRTTAGAGTSGKTGKQESFTTRGLMTWQAQTWVDGTWRLFSYDAAGPGSC